MNMARAQNGRFRAKQVMWRFCSSNEVKEPKKKKKRERERDSSILNPFIMPIGLPSMFYTISAMRLALKSFASAILCTLNARGSSGCHTLFCMRELCQSYSQSDKPQAQIRGRHLLETVYTSTALLCGSRGQSLSKARRRGAKHHSLAALLHDNINGVIFDCLGSKLIAKHSHGWHYMFGSYIHIPRLRDVLKVFQFMEKHH